MARDKYSHVQDNSLKTAIHLFFCILFPFMLVLLGRLEMAKGQRWWHTIVYIFLLD